MMRLIGILVAVLAVASAAPGAPDDNPFNVDFRIGWGGCYRPMEWTPVEIDISANFSQPFGGVVSVSAPQDQLTNMTVAHQFVLTPDLPQRIRLVTKLAFAADVCKVEIIDTSGRPCWDKRYELWGSSAPGVPWGSSTGLVTTLGREDMLIGVAGRTGFGLAALPGNAVSRGKDKSVNGKVYVKSRLTRSLPWDWCGYASLDLLVLYDPQWDSINVHQARAIRRWVTNGGSLLVILGARPLPVGHPIAALLPVTTGQARQMSPPLAWRKGAVRAKADKLTYWPLRRKPGVRVFDEKKYGTEAILSARGLVGFGRVAVLAFDPATMPMRQKKDRASFWISEFSPLLGDSAGSFGSRRIEFSEDRKDDDSGDVFHCFETGLADDGANQVMEHLLAIPELRPLEIGWVVLLLGAMALLLGPVDYFILKRIDRQPLTWLTSGGCILLFTLGAYYGVHALRSGELQVRTVSVTDGLADGKAAWATTYTGLFAPKSDNYRLEKLHGRQWWSAIAPADENLYAYNRQIATRNVYCQQHDGANLPYSLPINIWSMQCLLCESPLDGMPIRAAIRLDGERARLRLDNLADAPISDVTVCFGKLRIALPGTVPAGGGRDFVFTLRRGGATRSRKRQTGVPFPRKGQKVYLARGVLPRTRGINEYIRRGAAVVSARYAAAPVSFAVKGRPCNYKHVRLVRLVVFPEEGSAQ